MYQLGRTSGKLEKIESAKLEWKEKLADNVCVASQQQQIDCVFERMDKYRELVERRISEVSKWL